MDRPFGQSLLPLLQSLSTSSSNRSIPAFPTYSEPAPERDPSPDAIQLAQAIEEARRDSLKLEERRSTILEKVEKLEKKKAKKQQKLQQESDKVHTEKMADDNEEFAAAAAQALVEQMEKRPPQEPSVVFKGIIFS